MKQKFIDLLIENKIIPVQEPYWNSFEIYHNTPGCSKEVDDIRDYIRSQTKNVNGIYVYERDNKFIYIGKGKPISYRLFSHFRESYEQVSGDRTGKWHRFFKQYHGKLKVYWFELEDESVRLFVEETLQRKYQPEFLSFEK
ncbi:MAG: hypothetical protein K0R93_720 [Anaerosolibacter sp.]|uniref:hypothetical protein n=1 Tax=Anaerosolibacter sp. TaxID=1872527 RepID=UPI002618FCE7|nr:hypothetical protein [Anaerosolibacter sp.]MDF2545822.1 hypothetical protein [Anaerosolibacter sp.]